MKWTGVIPAITTQFNSDLSVDHEAIAKHVKWLVESGCTGIMALGSLGEGATLRHDEKVAILSTCVKAVGDQVPVVAGISALSTDEAIELARDAKRVGCKGLMVLPAYVYKGDWREISAHFDAIFQATDLSCMLYNNPIAYVVDVLPEQLAELASRNPNLHSVKESAGDVRRVTAIRNLLGESMAIFVGVDDLIVEAIQAGATGWIAGLVNAFPVESVKLYDLCMAGQFEEAFALYKWFLPLLKLDVVPKFVQLIKLTQQEVGWGHERVRQPRMELVGEERAQTLAVIQKGLAERPH